MIAKFTKRPCSYGQCKEPSNNAGIAYCPEHYLLKEAGYAVYGLEHDDHYATEGGKEFIQKMAVEQLIKYAKYKLRD